MTRHESRIEPAAGAERVSARGELGVLLGGGRTRIDRLYQEGAAKIRMPRTSADPLDRRRAGSFMLAPSRDDV